VSSPVPPSRFTKTLLGGEETKSLLQRSRRGAARSPRSCTRPPPRSVCQITFRAEGKGTFQRPKRRRVRMISGKGETVLGRQKCIDAVGEEASSSLQANPVTLEGQFECAPIRSIRPKFVTHSPQLRGSGDCDDLPSVRADVENLELEPSRQVDDGRQEQNQQGLRQPSDSA